MLEHLAHSRCLERTVQSLGDHAEVVHEEEVGGAKIRICRHLVQAADQCGNLAFFIDMIVGLF